MPTTIHFREVGRERRSWSHVFQRPELGEGDDALERIAQEAKRSGRLMSNDLIAAWHDDGMSGAILAGYHCVGHFHIVATASKPA